MPDGPSRYAYVTNSPLMYIDPTGEHKKDKHYKYRLSNKFWKWFHSHPDFKSLKEPDGLVCEADALSYHGDWMSCGCPGPGNY